MSWTGSAKSRNACIQQKNQGVFTLRNIPILNKRAGASSLSKEVFAFEFSLENCTPWIRDNWIELRREFFQMCVFR